MEPRVLIVPTHPGVQYHFCRVGVPTYFLGHWDQFKYWRPQPANVHNVLSRFEDAQLEYGPADYARLLDDRELVGWPERYETAWLMFNWQVKLFWDRPGKKLYRVSKIAELDEDLWARLLARDDFTVVSFYPSTVAWLKERFGVDVPYVPLGLDPALYAEATGEDANILSIIHSYPERGWHHRAWAEATEGLPTLHVDHLDPSKPVFEYADLMRALRRARLYLHDGEQEYTITLIEAMMTGLPLVSFRIPGIERYVEHGVNGLIGESAAEIRAHCRLLLADDGLAARMGAASREKALREFHEDRWRAQWRELLTKWCTSP
jgi:glycosyltransferase involved in cell wall biosynthesis